MEGTLNVMAYLRMIERPFTFVEHPVWLERVLSVTSEATGIFYPLVDRGTYVASGMKLGYVPDSVGRVSVIFEPRAPEAGVVTFVRAVPPSTGARPSPTSAWRPND